MAMSPGSITSSTFTLAGARRKRSGSRHVYRRRCDVYAECRSRIRNHLYCHDHQWSCGARRL
jgi:hypothetical protein